MVSQCTRFFMPSGWSMLFGKDARWCLLCARMLWMSTFKWCFDVFNGRSCGLECQEGCRGRHLLHFICMCSWNQKNWGSLQGQFRFRFKNKSQVNFETGGSKHARLSRGHFSLLNSSSVSSPSKHLVQSKTSMSRMLQQKPSLIGFSIQHPHQFFPRKSRLPMMLPNDAAQIRFPYCWSWLVVLHYNDQQLKLQSLWWSPMCTSFLLLGFGYIKSWPVWFVVACAICLFICPFRSFLHFCCMLLVMKSRGLGGTLRPQPRDSLQSGGLVFSDVFQSIMDHVSMGMGLAHGELWGSPHSGQAMIFKWMLQEITVDHNRLDMMSRFRCVFLCLCLKHNALLC